MTVTKQQVIAALAELRVNRPRRLADQNIRTLLRTYGAGATNITELKPEFYAAVYEASGGSMSFEEFYGVILDVQPAPTAQDCAVEPAPPAPAAPSIIRTPMVADLEARLKERAGKPRSKPTGRVSYGNPGQVGDQADDVAREFSSGEKMS